MNKSDMPKKSKGSFFATNSGLLHSATPTGTGNRGGSIKGVGAQFHTSSGTLHGNKPTGVGNRGGQTGGVGRQFSTNNAGIVQKAKPIQDGSKTSRKKGM